MLQMPFGAKKDGFSLIQGVISQFDAMAATLQEGMKMLQSAKAENEATISTLQRENEGIDAEVSRADGVLTNIKAILGNS